MVRWCCSAVDQSLDLFDVLVVVNILDTRRSGVATKKLSINFSWLALKLSLHLLRSDGSTNGLDAKVMPLRPLVAARAGS